MDLHECRWRKSTSEYSLMQNQNLADLHMFSQSHSLLSDAIQQYKGTEIRNYHQCAAEIMWIQKRMQMTIRPN